MKCVDVDVKRSLIEPTVNYVHLERSQTLVEPVNNVLAMNFPLPQVHVNVTCVDLEPKRTIITLRACFVLLENSPMELEPVRNVHLEKSPPLPVQ